MVKISAKKFYKRIEKMEINVNSIPWGDIGNEVKKSIDLNFDQSGRPTRWTPRKKNKPWPILKKSGKLKEGTYFENIKNGVAVGNRVIYQAVHNFGYPANNILQREYHMLQNDDIENIEQKIKKHIIS